MADLVIVMKWVGDAQVYSGRVPSAIARFLTLPKPGWASVSLACDSRGCRPDFGYVATGAVWIARVSGFTANGSWRVNGPTTGVRVGYGEFWAGALVPRINSLSKGTNELI